MTIDTEKDWRKANMRKAQAHFQEQTAERRAADPSQRRKAVKTVRAALRLGLLTLEEVVGDEG